VHTLYSWIKNDILSLIGPSSETRKELLAFVVEQLNRLEGSCPHKIKPVRTYLENHDENLLAFMVNMEMNFFEISQEFEVPLSVVWKMYQLKGLSEVESKTLGNACELTRAARA
jgi:hypothetical protein